jgi:cell wall-associated NlpC family hydrolase
MNYYLYQVKALCMRGQAKTFTATRRMLMALLICCFAAPQGYAQLLQPAPATNKKLLTIYQLLYQVKDITPRLAETKKTPTVAEADSLGASDEFTLDEQADAGKTAVAEDTRPQKTIITTQAKAKDKAEPLFDNETDQLAKRYAYMMEVEADEVNNLYLYKFIDQWYGVKYKYGGTDNQGIDCSAFAQKLYSSIYSVNLQRTSRQQHKNAEFIKKHEDAEEGDLVFFRMRHVRISHVGVYLTNGYFVHASRSRGVMISSLSDKYWNRRYAGCGRVEKDIKEASESEFLQ